MSALPRESPPSYAGLAQGAPTEADSGSLASTSIPGFVLDLGEIRAACAAAPR